jgi:hypothetical protein
MLKGKRRGLGYALLGAVAMALVFVTTSALAGSGIGGVFNLGQANTVDQTSTLSGTSSGAQLKVQNATTGAGYGLWGTEAGQGVGVYGTAATGTGVGVSGRHLGSSGNGGGVRGQSASSTGPGVDAINLAGGPALQATVKDNSVPPLKVNSTAKVANLNAEMLEGHHASDFLGCHNGGVWGHAKIDGTAASTSDYTTAGVDATSQFVCNPSFYGSNVLVKHISMGRWGVVFGDTNNSGIIGIGSVSGPLAQVTSQDQGKIVSTNGTTYQCAPTPPPYITCWDVYMTDAAGSPADGSFTITIG